VNWRQCFYWTIRGPVWVGSFIYIGLRIVDSWAGVAAFAGLFWLLMETLRVIDNQAARIERLDSGVRALSEALRRANEMGSK
jgi:hypothetical protein